MTGLTAFQFTGPTTNRNQAVTAVILQLAGQVVIISAGVAITRAANFLINYFFCAVELTIFGRYFELHVTTRSNFFYLKANGQDLFYRVRILVCVLLVLLQPIELLYLGGDQSYFSNRLIP